MQHKTRQINIQDKAMQDTMENDNTIQDTSIQHNETIRQEKATLDTTM